MHVGRRMRSQRVERRRGQFLKPGTAVEQQGAWLNPPRIRLLVPPLMWYPTG